jgi:hypothetical protein
VVCPFRRSLVVGGCVRTLRAEELAGDVEGLASHNDDLLAVEELLGDGAGKATEQVALAVDDLNGLSARRPIEYSWWEARHRLAGTSDASAWSVGGRLIGSYVQ